MRLAPLKDPPPHLVTVTQVYTLRKDYSSAYLVSCYLQATRPTDAEVLRDSGVFLYYLKRFPGAGAGALHSWPFCLILNLSCGGAATGYCLKRFPGVGGRGLCTPPIPFTFRFHARPLGTALCLVFPFLMAAQGCKEHRRA